MLLHYFTNILLSQAAVSRTIPVHEDGLYDLEAGVVEERRGETHGQQQRKPRQHEGLQQIVTFVIMSDIHWNRAKIRPDPVFEMASILN